MSLRADLAVLQSRMEDVSRDLTDMRLETRSWQAKHEVTHEADATQRAQGRRWTIGAAIAGLASMAAVVSMFVELLTRVHLPCRLQEELARTPGADYGYSDLYRRRIYAIPDITSRT